MNPVSPTNPGSDTGEPRYSFGSTWHVDASQDRVWSAFEQLLEDEHPFQWWPGMHSALHDDGIHVIAGSPVGYSLRFRLHEIEQVPRELVSLRSDGDLVGRAAMRLAPVDADHSTIDVTWMVDVTKPWMRRAEPVLRPVFVRAHDVLMRAGERGLNAWLRASDRDSDPVG